MEHTPKLLVWPKLGECRNWYQVIWWHPQEEVVWTRGFGTVCESMRVRYIADGHEEMLVRCEDDEPSMWRTGKGVAVEVADDSSSFKERKAAESQAR